MMCEAVEYHPYAACLMFKQCLNSETVRANLQAVRDDSYHQGRVAALRDAEVIAQFMVMATPSNVAAALRFMADKLEAQQAQEGVVGDGN
jgi:hypothetical protein